MTVPLRRRGTRAEALSGGVLHVVTPTLWYRTPEGVQGIKEVDRTRLVRGTPYGHSSHCFGLSVSATSRTSAPGVSGARDLMGLMAAPGRWAWGPGLTAATVDLT